MAKLNQIIAIESGIKSKAKAALDNLYKTVQRTDMFNGLVKTYQPKEEGDEVLPPDSKRVQLMAPLVLATLELTLSEAMQIIARKDWTNQAATANVKIDDKVILPDVPVSYLLYLEKCLVDIQTVINAIPVLDSAEDWKKDVNSGLYRTDSILTHRTKKVARPIVLYQATPEHPAQTQLIQEDIVGGYWSTIKQSGAMALPEKQEIMERVATLLKAVKMAREEANTVAEKQVPVDVGKAIFGYILNKE